MKFTVIWTPAAEQDLAAVWMGAANRDVMATAARIIDALLAWDPEQRGELRFDTVRTLSIAPLGVDFEVIESDRIVYVLSAWDTARNEPT